MPEWISYTASLWLIGLLVYFARRNDRQGWRRRRYEWYWDLMPSSKPSPESAQTPMAPQLSALNLAREQPTAAAVQTEVSHRG